jgi:hypothetical protein
MNTPDNSNRAVSRPGISVDGLRTHGVCHVGEQGEEWLFPLPQAYFAATRRRGPNSRKRNRPSRYQQLRDLARNPDEDTAAIARADRQLEFPRH